MLPGGRKDTKGAQRTATLDRRVALARMAHGLLSCKYDAPFPWSLALRGLPASLTVSAGGDGTFGQTRTAVDNDGFAGDVARLVAR